MKNPFEGPPIGGQPPKIETPPETPPDNEKTTEPQIAISEQDEIQRTDEVADQGEKTGEVGEELLEIFETEETKSELVNTLAEWTEEITPSIRARAEHFGLEKSEVEQIIKNLGFSFDTSISSLASPGKIEEIKRSANELIASRAKIPQETKIKFEKLLNELSRKKLFDLLDRKLQGNITQKEKILLDVLGEAEHKGQRGSYSSFDDSFSPEKLQISLLNSDTLEKYTSTFMHEFTHLALDRSVPASQKSNMLMNVGMQKMIKIAEQGEKNSQQRTSSEKAKTPIKKDPHIAFHEASLAIDESFAHLAAGRYGKEKREPAYDSYKNKIDPKLFQKIYQKISEATSKMSLKEFDGFAARIYSSFMAKGEQNLSIDDVNKIQEATIKEIDR